MYFTDFSQVGYVARIFTVGEVGGLTTEVPRPRTEGVKATLKARNWGAVGA